MHASASVPPSAEDPAHGGDLRSWLYTILTNLNRNRLRSLARRPAVQTISDNDASDMRTLIYASGDR